MSIVRRLARPLLATGYVAGGVEAFRNSSAAAEKLDPVLKQVEQVLPQVRPVTANRAQVAQGIAAAQVLAASALALSKLPRLSASVLLGTTAINTYVQYQSADTSTKEAKSNRRNNVFKNLSLVGAVMIASVDTSGNPSLAWRASHLADDVRKNAAKVSKDTKKKFAQAEKAVQDAVSH
ncbi:DoxX family protein [Kocuria sp. WRN011]|uniref:DoxX family membrane protein n=1 Tax=Kocuria carniphila TaxID=262208 RepID=A0ABV3UZ12_9MICC|nr:MULTISPECIES: DoxX family membrane protein [Kocuria]PBB08643.1 DoxX family protein [Kocuria sp. WRN011]